MPTPVGRHSWKILGLAIISFSLTGPGQTIGISVFIDEFVTDLNLTRSQVAGAYLVGTLTGSTLLPLVGRLVDRYGVRKGQFALSVVLALALINLSQVSNLVWLAAAFVGIRLVSQGGLSLVSTLTVSLHFTERRGMALGLFATISSTFMSLVPIGLAFSIAAYGWRNTWLLTALVVPPTLAAIALFGLRSLPTSSAQVAAKARLEDNRADTSFTRAQAVRSRPFWVLVSCAAASSMLGTALNFHQIDLLGTVGLTKAEAAIMFLPQAIGSAIAGLIVGFLADRIGTRFLPAGGMFLLVLTHLCAAFVGDDYRVIMYALMLGGMAGAVRTSTSSLLPEWFGTTHLGAIQGLLTFIVVMASAIGPVALAQLEVGFGSYRPAILVLSIIPIATMIFALGDYRNESA